MVRVQPLPSEAGTAGTVTATGDTPAVYSSGCRICDVDAGGFE